MITEEEWSQIRALVIAGQRQILDNPASYGLTWRRIPGTVVDGDDPTAVTLILDGDQSLTVVNAVSLAGGFSPDDRVMVDAVPPSGMYVMGSATAVQGYRYLTTVWYGLSGTFDYTLYPTLAYVDVQISGAGSGGGGCALTAAGQAAVAAGGGGGGYSRKLITRAELVSAGSTTVTLGTGGTGGTTAPTAGSAGTDSSFLGLITATGASTGGEAGTATATLVVTQPGTPGQGSGGDLNLRGGDGWEGVKSAGFPHQLGHGGQCPWLGGATRASAADAGGNGISAVAYGNGGSGGWNSASQGTGKTGGDGSGGLCQVDIYTY